MLLGLVEPLNKRINEVDRDMTRLTLEKLYLIRTKNKILDQCSKPEKKTTLSVRVDARDELGDLLEGGYVEPQQENQEIEYQYHTKEAVCTSE